MKKKTKTKTSNKIERNIIQYLMVYPHSIHTCPPTEQMLSNTFCLSCIFQKWFAAILYSKHTCPCQCIWLYEYTNFEPEVSRWFIIAIPDLSFIPSLEYSHAHTHGYLLISRGSGLHISKNPPKLTIGRMLPELFHSCCFNFSFQSGEMKWRIWFYYKFQTWTRPSISHFRYSINIIFTKTKCCPWRNIHVQFSYAVQQFILKSINGNWFWVRHLL